MIELREASPAEARAVFTHPEVWPHIHDDGAPSVEDWQPAESPLIHYLAIVREGAVIGCLMLYPLHDAAWELHSALLPEGRGSAIEATEKMLAWLWSHTNAAVLLTWVPAYNRPALAAARKGFIERACIPSAYRKGGVLHDLYLFGVNKCPQ